MAASGEPENLIATLTAERVYSDFRTAHKLVARGRSFAAATEGLEESLLGHLSLGALGAVIEDDEAFKIEIDRPGAADIALQAFENEGARRLVEGRLSYLASQLSGVAVGRTVSAYSLHGQRGIMQTYESVVGRQERGRNLSRVSGRIIEVDPAANTLTLQPARLTRAWLEQGRYIVPVLDHNGDDAASSLLFENLGWRAPTPIKPRDISANPEPAIS